MSRINQIKGKKVVDADYRMAIKVEPQDIAKGNRKEPNSCAIALACMREFDAISAEVHLSRTYIEFPKRWLRFVTPPSIRKEIVDFDQKGKFTPGLYMLTPPPPSEKLGVPIKRSAHPRKRRKHNKVSGVRSMSKLHTQMTRTEEEI